MTNKTDKAVKTNKTDKVVKVNKVNKDDKVVKTVKANKVVKSAENNKETDNIAVGSLVTNGVNNGVVIEIDKREEKRLDVFIVRFEDLSEVKVRRYNLKLVNN